ncbi:polysaccharide deacetylase family protein [Nitrososphaera viennensis]|uniref:Polysaccharide deacetylase family protein n=3 Tax=Nitrososphaera viennensis TaxID=1034015 RepID=A0A977IE78_9ARCH|nr:polysaccharide deacetylase family protein [Nitrososphaera viennensis]AIC14356.1 putative polysaccharide deacetylase domain containing protein [Nitrososphaera viennensis EN76]UVS69343.1 polysaccharide deacetylase family protein [Nitrososphaera viennensis]
MLLLAAAAGGNNIMLPTKAHALTDACNCVIFRLDDVQDFWLVTVQSAVIDKVVERNESLDLAIIMNHIGNDPAIVGKVRESIATGLIETSLHGWNHVDYRTLPLKEQQETLETANQKMEELFGSKTRIFVAPYNAYNDDTLEAASQAGLTILSSEFDEEMGSIYDPDEPDSPDNKIYKAAAGSDLKDQYGVYHLPQAIGFYTYDSEPPTKTPLTRIESQIDSTIASYGYAVVTLHPQDFTVKDANNNPTEAISQTEIDDLDALITWINDQGYHIGTFSSTVDAQTPPPAVDNNSTVSDIIAPLANTIVVPSFRLSFGN